MTEDVYRILYKSDVAIAGTRREIDQVVDRIVSGARSRNPVLGITGALVVVEHHFVQALEGPLNHIEDVFESICLDPRHRNVNLVEVTEAEKRTFGEWSMIRVPEDVTLERGNGGPRRDLWLSADMDAAEVIREMRTALARGPIVRNPEGAVRRRLFASIRSRSAA